MSSALEASMKIYVILSFLFVTLVDLSVANAETACPNIIGKTEIAWEKHEGPDFDVCGAFFGKERIAGVYLGNHPRLKPEQISDGLAGTVGNHQVKWRVVYEGSGKVFAETVFVANARPGAQFAHISISAKDEDELKSRIKLFERLSFN
jgi:hypothetical protein